jgi:hypothetical protein
MNRRYFLIWAMGAAAISYASVLRYEGSLFALTDLGLLRCIGGFCVGAAVSTIPAPHISHTPSKTERIVPVNISKERIVAS